MIFTILLYVFFLKEDGRSDIEPSSDLIMMDKLLTDNLI